MPRSRAEEPLPEKAPASLSLLSREVYRSRRPRLLKQPNSRDLVVLAAPDYEALTEALEVAAGLLRGDADDSAGRIQANAEVQDLLRRRIADAARLSA
ncbi:MAG TPA: hypothetical protein VFX49_21185 [Chloroflexota bacterium]|nr:hypothetical protein [Chloroflexota bacterium]